MPGPKKPVIQTAKNAVKSTARKVTRSISTSVKPSTPHVTSSQMTTRTPASTQRPAITGNTSSPVLSTIATPTLTTPQVHSYAAPQSTSTPTVAVSSTPTPNNSSATTSTSEFEVFPTFHSKLSRLSPELRSQLETAEQYFDNADTTILPYSGAYKVYNEEIPLDIRHLIIKYPAHLSTYLHSVHPDLSAGSQAKKLIYQAMNAYQNGHGIMEKTGVDFSADSYPFLLKALKSLLRVNPNAILLFKRPYRTALNRFGKVNYGSEEALGKLFDMFGSPEKYGLKTNPDPNSITRYQYDPDVIGQWQTPESVVTNVNGLLDDIGNLKGVELPKMEFDDKLGFIFPNGSFGFIKWKNGGKI